jgi:hypothetical protein
VTNAFCEFLHASDAVFVVLGAWRKRRKIFEIKKKKKKNEPNWCLRPSTPSPYTSSKGKLSKVYVHHCEGAAMVDFGCAAEP